jgi:hypothetical protein
VFVFIVVAAAGLVTRLPLHGCAFRCTCLHPRLQLKTSVLQNTIFAATNGVLSLAEIMVGSRPGLAVGGGDGSITLFLGSGKDFVDYSRRFVDGAVRSLCTGTDESDLCGALWGRG